TSDLLRRDLHLEAVPRPRLARMTTPRPDTDSRCRAAAPKGVLRMSTQMKSRPAVNGAANTIPLGMGSMRPSVTELTDRRRAAARRLPVLDHGVRDPWSDRPRPALRPGALADALAHLDRHGLTGLAPVDQLRQAWETADPAARTAIARAA